MSIVDVAKRDIPSITRELPASSWGNPTVFKNLIPYLKGQTEGDFHTWDDILEFFTSYEEFVFDHKH